MRQYRHGIAQRVLELPSGDVDAEESPAACAKRELAEETGYVSDTPEYLASFIFDPARSTTLYHLFVSRNARPALEPTFERTERIEIELAPLDQVRRYVRDGRIDVSAHVASIYYVLDRLGRL